MTRPPSKRVSRGQPIRRGGAPKKGGGCAMTVAALTLAATSLTVGLVLLIALASRINGAEAYRGSWSVVLLLALFWLHFQTSRLITTPDRSAPSDAVRRDVTPVGPVALRAERPVGSTKLPPSRASEVWTATAG